MRIAAKPASLDAILAFRQAYRLEMACQIVHDSIHARPGWTKEYLLRLDDIDVGYGSVAIGGPWAGKPTVYEFYVVPRHRTHAFELFGALLHASGAAMIEVQSNDVLAAVILHAYGRDVTSEKILFENGITTNLSPPSALFRYPTPAEAADAGADDLRWRGVVEVEGQVAASGGVLFHYNPPYGDIYMEVAEPFRRRGLGAFLVQELKRLCHEGGRIPAARCDTTNVASRRTLQKAGLRAVRAHPQRRGVAVKCGASAAGRLRWSMAWTTLCDLDELREGAGHYVDIDGRELAVFLYKGRPHVMDNTCPHAGGSLSGGHVEDMGGTPCAVCPVHCWPFRLEDGEYYDMPGFEVKVYPVRMEEFEGQTLVQADLPMP